MLTDVLLSLLSSLFLDWCPPIFRFIALPINRSLPSLHLHENLNTTTPNERPQQIDFAHYKNIIKNQKVVSELESAFKSFKPVDYDVAAQLKAIDAFQEKAVSVYSTPSSVRSLS